MPKPLHHEEDLDTLKRKAEESPSDEAGSSGRTSKRSSRKSSTEARVYEQKCIFCDQEKRVKNIQSREKLVQAVQLRADKTLRECAIQRGDDKIIAVTSRDIVAAEAHYHISCYKEYTKVKKSELKDTDQTNTESDGDEQYQKIVREAYEKLFEFIRSDVLDSKSIVPVTFLTEKLESIMLSLGVQHMQDTTRKHIRRKLETELGESVDILPDNKGKLLMFPEGVLLRDVVVEHKMKHTL
ncbi:uncharacterized protein LOC134246311 [Saccostrea cucullata]|uniref:uncharacterized protein LOC134246311 n=1 Tax=Saccostrea cuccullata TaxID=36930 RepID=UPI002ED6ADBB